MILAWALLAMTNFGAQMSVEEQKETGVYCLTPDQRMKLENWIDKHCRLYCMEQREMSTKNLSLFTNIDGGRKLELSNGNIYEVSPDDLNVSSSWITPFPLRIEASDDPYYPLRLVNIHTGRSVKVKKVS